MSARRPANRCGRADDRHASGGAASARPRAPRSASSKPGRRPPPGTRRRPRAPPAPRPSCRAPARRRGTSGAPRAHSGRRPTGTAPARRRAVAATSSIGSAGGRARAADRLLGGAVLLGHQSRELLGGGRRDLDLVQAMNASSWSAIHGSSLSSSRTAPGSCSNAAAISGSQRTSSTNRSPATPRARISRAGGGCSPCSIASRQRRAPTLRRGSRSSRSAAAVSRRQRHQPAPLVLDRTLSQQPPGACRRACRAPTSRGRRGGSCARGRPSAARPRRASRRTPRSGSARGTSRRISTSRAATQSSAGADHSRRSQSNRRPGSVRTAATRWPS